MEAENQITRDERISNLQAEHDKRMSNAEAFKRQHLELLVGLKETDELLAQRVRDALEDNPDASPKKLVDQVLQLSSQKKDQLLQNIKKMQLAEKDEVQKARVAAGEKKRLLDEIREAEINEMTRSLYNHFEEWTKKWNDCEDYFYRLVESVRIANMDAPGWHLRGGKLGLNPLITVCFDSYFKDLEHVSMNSVVVQCSEFSTAEGKPLFKKLANRMQDVPVLREHFFTK